MRGAISLLVLFLSALVAQAEEVPIRPGHRVAIVGNTYADQLRVHGYLETLLRLQAGPGDPIQVRNLGWAGDMLTARDRPTGFPSEESTLTKFGADVIIACFGLGESFRGEAGLADFRKDLLEFLASHEGKTYRQDGEPVRLVLVSPIAYENLGSLTPNWEKRNAELKAYSEVMAAVAVERKIAFVDLLRSASELMNEEGAPDLTTNGVTMGDYGYWALSTAAADRLVAGASGWNLTLDVSKGTASESKGLRVDAKGTAVEGGFEFQVTELTPPAIAPPGDGTANRSLRERRDLLTIHGLDPGDHVLSVDGTKVARASAADWAAGVVIHGTPTHQVVEKFREAINDKNLQWTYAWKAYNQVHIVGERRTSPAGKALPAELIEHAKVVEAREEELAKGIELATRTWSIIRAK